MKLSRWSLPVFATSVVAGLTLLACQTSGHVDSGGTIKTPAGDVTFSGHVGLNEGTFNAQNNTSKCFKITFKDGAGNVTGSVTLSPGGGSGTIPAGTTNWEAKESPCPGLQGPTHGYHEIAFDRMQNFITWGGPMTFEENSPTGNALYSFVVRAHSQDEAESITHAVLTSPIGTQIDPRVSVWLYNRTEMHAGSASLFSIAKSQFSAWEMDLNGQADYATLQNGNAVQSRLGPNLWAVEVTVPFTDMNGTDVWNTGWFRYQQGSLPNLQANYQMLYSSH